MKRYLNNSVTLARTGVRAVILIVPMLLVLLGEACHSLVDRLNHRLPGWERWQE